MTAREVSSERVSEELAEEIAARWPADKKALFTAVCNEALNDGQYINAYELTNRLYSALRSSVKTVPEALEQLRAAIKAADADKSRRNELLATLLVNIEKNEPTAEFAVALRDFVREERPKLSAIEAPAAEGEAFATAWQLAYKGDDWHFARKASFASIDMERGIVRNVTPLYTRASPAAPSEVTEEMVQKAWEAYDAKSGYSKPERFHSALTAALKGDRP